MASQPLCIYFRESSHGQREVICSLKTDHATALVLAILGTCMLFAGTYLMFGPIGTIPASMGGFSLILAGTAALISSIVITAKAKL